VPREQEDEHLVADLRVGERLAVVARGDQQPDQVLCAVRRGAARLDELVADVVERLLRVRRAPVRGVGQERGGLAGLYGRRRACSPRTGKAALTTGSARSTSAPNSRRPTTRSVRREISACTSTGSPVRAGARHRSATASASSPIVAA